MARIRAIKPGIMTNEDLCELGPYAYILFTCLWMVADREGRFEFRPKRLKAQCMPLWDEVSWRDVEKLVENLRDRGFVILYEIGGVWYGAVQNWKKHQHCDVREATSEIPPPHPPESTPTVRKQRQVPSNKGDTKDSGITQTSLGNSAVETGSSWNGNGYKSGGEKTSDSSGIESHSPTTPKTTEKPERKPPAAAAENPPPKPTPEDMSILRESLDSLANEIHMAPVDDPMLLRIFAAGHGATGMEIHQALVALYKEHKFDSIHSWGLLPLVIAQCFGAQPRARAS
jgi:hypothetical protein